VSERTIESLEMENAYLRVKVQELGCPYGHDVSGMSGCPLGFPGCSCMDDLLATMAWCPEDEEKANVRLGKRIKELEGAVERMREQCLDAFPSPPVGEESSDWGRGYLAARRDYRAAINALKVEPAEAARDANERVREHILAWAERKKKVGAYWHWDEFIEWLRALKVE